MTPTRAFGALAFAAATLVGMALPSPALCADDEQQGLKLHPAVVAADWAQVKELLIELADHNFEPNELTLKRGVPYMLRLKNTGSTAHDMVGGTFFGRDVIALRMVNSRVGRVTADDISSIYIRPKNDTELWFVPLKTGVFSFVCSIPGHKESGMEGQVRIVD